MTTTGQPSSPTEQRARTVTALLLACGVLYGVTYVIANDVVAAAILGDYDPIDQAVSELSAAGVASRPFLVVMAAVWGPMLTAFGIGVWRAAAGPVRSGRRPPGPLGRAGVEGADQHVQPHEPGASS